MLSILIAYAAGIVTALVYNYLRPAKFDELTDKAAGEVKGAINKAGK